MEVGLSSVRFPEIGITSIRFTQVRFTQVGLIEFDSAQVSSTEVETGEVEIAEIGPMQVGFPGNFTPNSSLLFRSALLTLALPPRLASLRFAFSDYPNSGRLHSCPLKLAPCSSARGRECLLQFSTCKIPAFLTSEGVTLLLS